MIGVGIGDAFKFIELLFKGLELYVGADKRLFTDHIGPCFAGLCEIQKDYANQIWKAIEHTENAKTFAELDKFVTEAALNKALERTELSQFARMWHESRTRNLPAEARAFFKAVLDYFMATEEESDERSYGYGVSLYEPMRAATRRESWSKNLQDARHAVSTAALSGQLGTPLSPEIAQLIKRALEEMQMSNARKWERVARTFAEAKIALLR
jgi:hypothetical protein